MTTIPGAILDSMVDTGWARAFFYKPRPGELSVSAYSWWISLEETLRQVSIGTQVYAEVARSLRGKARLTRFFLALALFSTSGLSNAVTIAAPDAALGAVSDGVSAEQNTPALFTSTGEVSHTNEPRVLSLRKVTIAADALDRAALLIMLDDSEFLLHRAHIEQRAQQDRQTWRGSAAQNPADSLLITRLGHRYSGRIQLDGRMFRIRSDARGESYLLELAPRRDPIDTATQNRPAAPLQSPPSARVLTLQATQSAPSSSLSIVPRATTLDGVVQDLLVVYNQAACNDAGGCAQLELDILNAVAGTNAAYARSQVGIMLNLVGMRWVDYVGGDFSSTLTRLAARAGSESDPGGVLDEVLDLRDQVGADLVTMVIRRNAGVRSCGLAYLLPGDGAFSAAPFAYNVIDMSTACQPSDLILAHEIGHNQGADHDRQTAAESARLVNPEAPNLPQPGEYQFGFRRCKGGSVDDFGAAPYFYTIMAYQCGVVQPIMYFSNPDVTVSGVGTGVDPLLDPERAAFSARTLNESASGVAAFREALPYAPLPPSNLLARATGAFSVELYWVDNATNEESFEIERATAGSDWSQIATVDADLEAFIDNSAKAETHYSYRVRARNSAGYSSYSAPAHAQTEAAPPMPQQIPMLPRAPMMALFTGLMCLMLERLRVRRIATSRTRTPSVA